MSNFNLNGGVDKEARLGGATSVGHGGQIGADASIGGAGISTVVKEDIKDCGCSQ